MYKRPGHTLLGQTLDLSFYTFLMLAILLAVSCALQCFVYPYLLPALESYANLPKNHAVSDATISTCQVRRMTFFVGSKSNGTLFNRSYEVAD